MQPTRRFWAGVGVGLSLVALSLLIARPVLLVGASGVFAWLLGAQVAFTRALTRFDGSLAVEQELERAAVVDEFVTVTVVADGDVRGLDVSLRARPTAGLDVEGELSGAIEDPVIGRVRSPVAGTHALQPPEFTVRDASGLFVERLRRGPERELEIEPRRPSRVHVGEGGDAIPVAFGEHTVETPGSGIVPAEIREYVGDEAPSRIDWKATARLGAPHVREFEAEADVTTFLVVDHRGNLDVGPAGETALDYLRAAAISYVAVRRSNGDPVGCYAVDEAAVQRLAAPTNAPRDLELLRRRLTALEATAGESRTRVTAPLPRRATALGGDTEYGRTLAAFVGGDRTATRGAGPLVSAVRAATRSRQGTVEVALFTDDTDRAGVRDAVSAARQGDNHVVAFLAPRVLYEPDTLADLPAAIDRYREFEEFRRDLAAIDRVRAYEVAPRDRMEALLEAQKPPTR